MKTKKKPLGKTAKKAKAKKSPTKKKAAPKIAKSRYMNVESDPAHSPGHRRLPYESPAPSAAFSEKTTPLVQQKENPAPMNRRIITGAAVGKTGRLFPK